jgi:GntR family transcriptional regulator
MFNIVHMVCWACRRDGVREDDSVTGPVGQPAYQQVADELRRLIAAGELAVGSAIPSTAKLTRQYGVSSTVARAAVAQLRADDLVVGHPGKGVFVQATPGDVAGRAATLDDLAGQVVELRELWGSEVTRREELAAEVADLRSRVTELADRIGDSVG